MINSRTLHFSILLLLTSIMSNCTTRRNSASVRAYHKLTTRYNIYHNAEKQYLDIMENRLATHRESRFQLLSFYPVSEFKDKSGQGGVFDPIIDKTTKAIQQHSISSKPQRNPSKAGSAKYREWLKQKEFNPFIKNVWFLLGKSHLHNQDWSRALSVFSEIVHIYGEDLNVTSEAQIWQMRTYIEMGHLYDAENLIYILQGRKLPTDLNRLFNETYSFYLMEKRQYSDAIPYLTETIKQENIVSQKKRLQFLLGQIQTVLGDERDAYQTFKSIGSLNNPFELNYHLSVYRTALSSGKQQNRELKRWEGMRQKLSSAELERYNDELYLIASEFGADSLRQTIRQSLITGHQSWGKGSEEIQASERIKEGNRNHLAKDQSNSSQDSLYSQNIVTGLSKWKILNISSSRQTRWSNDSTIEAKNRLEDKEFVIDKTAPYQLLLLPNQSADINRLLFATANFNFNRFERRLFKLTSVTLRESEAIKIGRFHSFDDAEGYMQMICSDDNFRKTFGDEGLTIIIISDQNLALVQQSGNLNEYILFQKENYNIDPETACSEVGEQKDINSTAP